MKRFLQRQWTPLEAVLLAVTLIILALAVGLIAYIADPMLHPV